MYEIDVCAVKFNWTEWRSLKTFDAIAFVANYIRIAIFFNWVFIFAIFDIEYLSGLIYKNDANNIIFLIKIYFFGTFLKIV